MKLINTLSELNRTGRTAGTAAILVTAALVLTACGDSDLTEIQLDAIAEAQRRAANAPPATPITGEAVGPETVEMVDGESAPLVTGTEIDLLIADATLVFSDEFNGNGIDSGKWSTKYIWGPNIVVNDEKQFYPDTLVDSSLGMDPFVFNGQSLSITAQATPSDKLADANSRPYVSGVITSYDRYDFTYGYTEIRAKLPAGQGYWPGFWMLGTDFEDLKPQLYVMESKGSATDTVYHRYNYSDAAGEFVYSDLLPSSAADGADFSSDFHTFGVDWSAGEITFYVDGIKTHTFAHDNVSRQKMYVILNLAVGGWFPGAPDANTPLPGAFEIDYVRIYKKN